MVDLSETWIDLWKNSRDFYLPEWDINIDGPYPAVDPEFQDQGEQGESSDSPDKKEEPEPFFPPNAPKNRGVSWFNVEEAPPQGKPKTPMKQEEEDAKAEAEDSDYEQPDPMIVLDTSDEDSSGSVIDGDLKAEQQLDDEVTDTLVDADEIHDAPPPPLSPRKLQSGKMYYGRVDPCYCPVMSRTFSHIKVIEDIKNLVYVTLDKDEHPSKLTFLTERQI